MRRTCTVRCPIPPPRRSPLLPRTCGRPPTPCWPPPTADAAQQGQPCCREGGLRAACARIAHPGRGPDPTGRSSPRRPWHEGDRGLRPSLRPSQLARAHRLPDPQIHKPDPPHTPGLCGPALAADRAGAIAVGHLPPRWPGSLAAIGRRELIAETLHPRAEGANEVRPAAPAGGRRRPYRGLDGLRNWWEGLFGEFPDFKLEYDQVPELGDVTVARVRISGQGPRCRRRT